MSIQIKINKVVPEQHFKGSRNSQFFLVHQKKYFSSPTNVNENYTGIPVYFLFTITLPHANYDYQYLKVQIRVESFQFTKVVHQIQQTFKDIAKNYLNRQIVLEFTPNFRGKYTLNIDTAYRGKYLAQGSQPPGQKRDHNSMHIRCQQLFKIQENIVREDTNGSVTFPLFLQYTVESQLPNIQIKLQANFQTQHFKFNQLHETNKLSLRKGQPFYLMYEIQPKNIKQILKQKGINIGSLKLRYGEKGFCQKKTSLKIGDKYIFFKAVNLTKQVPKKDIAEVKILFSKFYNLNFNLGALKLQIDEKQMPQVKILKTSVDKIHLDTNREVTVNFSIICFKSGILHLKGISLKGNENRVFFINDIYLVVGSQPEHKAANILQNTTQITIDSLI